MSYSGFFSRSSYRMNQSDKNEGNERRVRVHEKRTDTQFAYRPELRQKIVLKATDCVTTVFEKME